jgi:hypothetical protein
VYSTGWRLVSFRVPSIRSGRKFCEMSLNTNYSILVLSHGSAYGACGPEICVLAQIGHGKPIDCAQESAELGS